MKPKPLSKVSGVSTRTRSKSTDEKSSPTDKASTSRSIEQPSVVPPRPRRVKDPKKQGTLETKASSQTPKKGTSPIVIISPDKEEKPGIKSRSGSLTPIAEQSVQSSPSGDPKAEAVVDVSTQLETMVR